MNQIEFWRSGEWTMVYLDGELVKAGDHYHADEWLQERCNVTVIDDDAGDCIPDGHNALRLLDEARENRRMREERQMVIERMRKDAADLLQKATEMEEMK